MSIFPLQKYEKIKTQTTAGLAYLHFRGDLLATTLFTDCIVPSIVIVITARFKNDDRLKTSFQSAN
jgi:hypothetical protein